MSGRCYARELDAEKGVKAQGRGWNKGWGIKVQEEGKGEGEWRRREHGNIEEQAAETC